MDIDNFTEELDILLKKYDVTDDAFLKFLFDDYFPNNSSVDEDIDLSNLPTL